VYQDDPTLPAGKLIQVDWAVENSCQVYSHYRDKDGNIIREKYSSNYIAWVQSIDAEPSLVKNIIYLFTKMKIFRFFINNHTYRCP
jgi:hypothetical protein